MSIAWSLAILYALACPALAQAPDPSAPPPPAALIERLVVRDVMEADGSSERTLEARIALHDAAGVAQFGQLESAYVAGYGEVSFEDVVAVKPSGQRRPIAGGKVEDLNPFGTSPFPVPADVRVRRMTLPGLEPGDVLEYRIRLRQKALYRGVAIAEWKFTTGPVRTQVYEADLPSDGALTVRLRPGLGADWEDVAGRAGRKVRRLTLEGPLPEPTAADWQAAQEPDVAVTSFRTWEDVGAWWWNLARPSVVPDASVRAEALRLAAGAKDTREKIDAFYAFVAGQVRYLNVAFGVGRLEPRPAPEVLQSRYGDCKGKHALLAALAASAGIDVWPALVHSARADLRDEGPSPAQFDHVLSVLPVGDDPAGWLWIDATSDIAPAGYLPPHFRGKRALVIAGGSPRVVTVPERPPFRQTIAVETTGRISPAGPIDARVRWTIRDDREPMMRATFRAAPADTWKDIAKRMAREWSRGEVQDITVGDARDLAQPLWVEYTVRHAMGSGVLAKSWDFWVPLPDLALPEPTEDLAAEPLVKWFGADEVVLRARIRMPDGMAARPPLSVTLTRPFATYQSRYAVEDGDLVVERSLVFTRRTLAAGERAAYESFRSAVASDRRQEFAMAAWTPPAADPPGTADELFAAGSAALHAKDFRKAVVLLRQTVEKDPAHRKAWGELGVALRDSGQPVPALLAFRRQIEADPYHPSAYVDRGLTCERLGREKEAAWNYAKQIEVAPFESDAYVHWAAMHTRGGRFSAAAALLEKAAAASPSDADVWLSLAFARQRAGAGDVIAAAARVGELKGTAWALVRAARAMALAGGVEPAGELAAQALTGVLAHFGGTPDSTDPQREPDLLYLAEAWRLVGAAALAREDVQTAERYLVAAWELASTADASVDLAALRERQGRQAEGWAAIEQAAHYARPTPNPARVRLERRIPDPQELAVALQEGNHALARRHLHALPGPPPNEILEARLWIVVDSGGRILDVGAKDPQLAPRLAPLRERILRILVPSSNPGSTPFTLRRGASLTCFPRAGCTLGLDLYAEQVGRILEQ